jgi:hypothetical protein
MSAAKECKYGCGTLISWDAKNSRFIEADGTPHTKERCESLKQTKPEGKSEMAKMHDENMVANRLLVAAVNRLAAAMEARV